MPGCVVKVMLTVSGSLEMAATKKREPGSIGEVAARYLQDELLPLLTPLDEEIVTRPMRCPLPLPPLVFRGLPVLCK